MKIHWATPASGNERGNSLGYSYSNRQLRKAMHNAGVGESEDAKIALHYGFAGLYKRIPGKINILFTMFESPHLPEEVNAPLRDADAIIVPSLWCAQIFERHTTKPIYVCPLGVDLSAFPFKKRDQRRNRPFRWLYVGAPNYRKLTVVPELYQALFRRTANAELYIKMTGASQEGVPEMLEDSSVEQISEGLWRSENCTVDNRFIPHESLIRLYHWADGFLFAHCGEGFGLTGLEAMATGLAPVITAYSGVMEYATPESARLCRYCFGALPTEDARTGETVFQWLGWPNREDVVNEVTKAMLESPKEALRRGRLARARAEEFSWQATAQDLCRILSEYDTLDGVGANSNPTV